jgi:hypothetical protein
MLERGPKSVINRTTANYSAKKKSKNNGAIFMSLLPFLQMRKAGLLNQIL